MATAMKIVKTENEEKKQVGNISEILQQQLAEITRKKRLADHRQIFLTKQDSLKEFQKSIEEEKENGSFDSSKFKISLAGNSSYRDEEKISIQNVDLILEFINMLNSKIDENVSKIETDLIG